MKIKPRFLIGVLITMALSPRLSTSAMESTDIHEQVPKLTYIGHATVLIQGTNHSVLTDPYFGSQILLGLKRKVSPAPLPPDLMKIDFVLISHTHPDHYNPADIQKLPGHPTIVIPWRRGKELRRLGFQVVELRPWASYEISGLKITATPARHMWGNCLGYVIEIDERKIYFTGDTKLFKSIDRVREMGIDLMLLPYGGYPVLGSIWTTSQAVEAVSRVNPKIVVPIHWGTFGRWWTNKEPEGPTVFVEMVKARTQNVRSELLQVGESIQLKKLGPGLDIGH